MVHDGQVDKGCKRLVSVYIMVPFSCMQTYIHTCIYIYIYAYIPSNTDTDRSISHLVATERIRSFIPIWARRVGRAL